MDYLLLVAALHLIVCPFTKVDEYFNVQAMHDILYHGRNLSQYHHHDSEVDIPQTFIGAIIISVLVSPVNYLMENCGLPGITKFTAQIIVRAGLGACVIWSYILLKNAVKDRFGKQVANWFIVISCSQFHFMFYCTRPLSNMMVMPFVLLALHYWLLENHRRMIWLSAASVVIFKPELTSLFAMIIVFEVIQRRISCKKALQISLQAGLGCLFITVLIDSCMWRRPTWPAGEASLMGVVHGQRLSTTQSFLWYWYSAIPRALSFSTVFVPIGVYLERRMIPLLSVCSTFILLNSFLPHKESRFIIYAFPLFNVIASCGCNILWNGRHKSFIRKCLGAAAALHLGGNVIITVILLSIAYSNYPGGAAIQRLHSIIPSDSKVDVYIDNVALQSGVTRFTEINNNWKYNTSDSVNWQNGDILKFTHLMIEARSKYSKNLRPFFKSHDVIDSVEGFSHLHINYQYFPPFKIKKKPILSILQRKDSFGMGGRQEIDEILGLLPEDEMESTEEEEQLDDFQLDSQSLEIINQTQDETETDSEGKQKTTNKISMNKAKTPNNVDLIVGGKAVANNSAESITKSPKLLVGSIKGKHINQSVEPDNAINHTIGQPESNRSGQERDQMIQTADSIEVYGDFLGEPNEITPTPIEKMSKSHSRRNKSTMKTIRSKTNNLAFDALQDALREEEMSRTRTPGTPENQLVMMMPLVSGRRKFIMPNIDPSVNKRPEEKNKLVEQSTEEAEEFPLSSHTVINNSPITEDKPTESESQTQTREISRENAINHPYTKDAAKPDKHSSVNSHVNEMVQYNPKSIQLTVLNQGENAHKPKEPSTEVDISVTSFNPSQTEVALNKRQNAAKDPLNVKMEQALEVNARNALQIYGTKASESQRDSTSPAEETKLKHNSNSGKKGTQQKSMIFIWFPEETKVIKEQIQDGALSSQIQGNENDSSNHIPERITSNPEEPIWVKESQRYNSGKNINKIPNPSSQAQVVTSQKKEQGSQKAESTSNASGTIIN